MFELENCVSYIATNAAKDLADGFERKLKKQGISRVQWTALYHIGKNKKINHRELSRLMRIRESSTTRLVDRMVKEDLVERRLSEKDRREIYLVLTEKGQKLRSESLQLGQEYSDMISQGIGEEDLNNFYRVLELLRQNALKQD